MPDPKIVKDGGYQPTTDPGPIPSDLIRRCGSPPIASTASIPGDALRELARALRHKQRRAILLLLNARDEASPRELAGELGEGLSQVSYNVKQLLHAGIVEESRCEQERGAIEHFFCMPSEVRVALASMLAMEQVVTKSRGSRLRRVVRGDGPPS